MIYLLAQILLPLALAALLGGALGWLAQRSRSAARLENARRALAQQTRLLGEARGDVAMLGNDFEELRERSRREIETLRAENRELPILADNLEKSQLLVRQMIKRHESQTRELSNENVALGERVVLLEAQADVRERAFAELEAAHLSDRVAIERGETEGAVARDEPADATLDEVIELDDELSAELREGVEGDAEPDAARDGGDGTGRGDVPDDRTDVPAARADTETEAGAGAGAGAGAVIDAGAGTGFESRTDAGAETVAETDAVAESHAGTGTGTGSDADADAGAEARPDTGAETGTDTRADDGASASSASDARTIANAGDDGADGDGGAGGTRDAPRASDAGDAADVASAPGRRRGDEADATLDVDVVSLDDAPEPADPPHRTDPPLFRPVDRQDDLQRIFGIGPVTERALNALGITSYPQLAELERHEIEKIADALQIGPERIERDDWVGNARRQLEEVLEQL